MAVALSAGIRSALTSLQGNAADQSVAKQRLSTGLKVSSAIDNPVNFFTARGLKDRGTQLSGLLDGMSNAVKTLQAASKGIDGVTSLIKSAQGTLKQAQTDALASKPTKTGSALAVTAEVTATGTSLKDVALNKVISGAAAAQATASSAGSLGVDMTTNTSMALYISAGNTTFNAALSATTTVRDLVNTINSSGIATAAVDDAGKLTVTGTGSSTLKIGVGTGTSGALAATNAAAGGVNTTFGLLAADASTGLTASSNSAVRASLIDQFNTLRTQIDELAKDSSFNGTNLLQGNKMTVVFNEKTGSSQNKIDVQGQTISAANLGVGTATQTTGAGNINFQNDTELATAQDTLTQALSSLKAISSNFGANLSVVQTRQDFSQSLIDTLNEGADSLVNADTNAEAANLLALQTRQQLSQTALSLSNQADQAILRLF